MRLCVSFNEIDSDICAKFIQTECIFNTNFVQTECTLNTSFGEVFRVKSDDVYEGDYDVIPRVYQQVLPTKDKLMLDNVTVEIIPLAKVINVSNGYTVTIG